MALIRCSNKSKKVDLTTAKCVAVSNVSTLSPVSVTLPKNSNVQYILAESSSAIQVDDDIQPVSGTYNCIGFIDIDGSGNMTAYTSGSPTFSLSGSILSTTGNVSSGWMIGVFEL